ncbi:MAG: hypothetical protein HC904_00275 [Blastochloris sp.]|nr:hypothetical protein [Blastochloris sp.]
MTIQENKDKFDNLQMELLYQHGETIKRNLESLNLPADKVKELTGSMLFDIACISDGSTVMKTPDGDPIQPILMFSDGEGSEDLIHAGGGLGCMNMHLESLMTFLNPKI